MSSVYVAAASKEGPCKIGVSVNPADRVASLQTGNHAKLSLVKAVETAGTQVTEGRVHDYLKHTRLIGEWFGVDAIQAENAITAISNWGDELSRPPHAFVKFLAQDVEGFCPAGASVQRIVQLALLIAEVPEYRADLRNYLSRARKKVGP